MTEGRFVSDIRADVLRILDGTPMSMSDLCKALPDDDFVIEAIMLGLAKAKLVMMEPGSLGKHWTTVERVKARQEAGA